jgi:hypothetical protein
MCRVAYKSKGKLGKVNHFIDYADWVMDEHCPMWSDKWWGVVSDDKVYDEWLLKLYMRGIPVWDAAKILERGVNFYSKRFDGVQLKL